MRRIGLIVVCALVLTAQTVTGVDFPVPDTVRSWDVPEYVTNGVRAVWLEGVPWKGKPTRVFAYYGLPKGATADKKVPGIDPIEYGSIVPKKAECENLLVPVCVSASHIAYGSIRMESVFFALGQVAGTAAVLALSDGVSVQDIGYDRLRDRLVQEGQVLSVEESAFP